MDAMDILGSLLGGGRSQGGSGGGLGGKILKDLMGGSGRPTTPPSARPSQRTDNRPISADERARELEDLLGVAQGRSAERSHPHSQPQPAPTPPRYQAPPPPSRPQYRDPPAANRPSTPPQNAGFPHNSGMGENYPTGAMTQNDEALVLVRAMINAAKADGSISQEEQQAIIERISNPTQETINFLREEFNSPLNVRDFAWSVPLGMEQQVYTMSLATIQLDTNPEASYLRDLAHGLRLDAEFCNDLHRRYGAPTLF